MLWWYETRQVKQFLIAHKFSTDFTRINESNPGVQQYYNPLTLAVKLNDLPMCKLLQRAGALLDAPNALGNTALHIAVDNKFDNIVDWLLANKATSNLENHNKETARQIAGRLDYNHLAEKQAEIAEKLSAKARRSRMVHCFITFRL